MNVTTAMHVILDYFLSKRWCLGLAFYDLDCLMASCCALSYSYCIFPIQDKKSRVAYFSFPIIWACLSIEHSAIVIAVYSKNTEEYDLLTCKSSKHAS